MNTIATLFPQWVAAASRAPSAHNVQPARWHLSNSGSVYSVYLLEDRQRRLHVADASERDHQLSLGAAFEGLALAAAGDGFQVGEPEFNAQQPSGDELHWYARAAVSEGSNADELANWITQRTTYRDLFMPLEEVEVTSAIAALEQHRCCFIRDAEKIKTLADVHDQCSLDLAAEPAFYRELYQWLRFNRRHKDWHRDGLSGESLAMSGLEQQFGALGAHPWLFQLYCRLGLGKLLVAEEKKTCSASFLLVVLAPSQETRFASGRNFYRLWLAIAALGLHACPMSALVDHEKGLSALKKAITIDGDQQIINVFRVGKAASEPPPAARLPKEELLVEVLPQQ